MDGVGVSKQEFSTAPADEMGEFLKVWSGMSSVSSGNSLELASSGKILVSKGVKRQGRKRKAACLKKA